MKLSERMAETIAKVESVPANHYVIDLLRDLNAIKKQG